MQLKVVVFNNKEFYRLIIRIERKFSAQVRNILMCKYNLSGGGHHTFDERNCISTLEIEVSQVNERVLSKMIFELLPFDTESVFK